MIKYMREKVTESCLLRAHNITAAQLYKIIAAAVDNEFTLDGNTYQLTDEDSYEYRQKRLKGGKKKSHSNTTNKKIKHPTYNLSKGNLKHNAVSARFAAVILERGVSGISQRTKKKSICIINKWTVERYMV